MPARRGDVQRVWEGLRLDLTGHKLFRFHGGIPWKQEPERLRVFHLSLS